MPITGHAALALVDYRRLFACVCNGVSCNGYIYGKTEKFNDTNVTISCLKKYFIAFKCTIIALTLSYDKCNEYSLQDGTPFKWR